MDEEVRIDAGGGGETFARVGRGLGMGIWREEHSAVEDEMNVALFQSARGYLGG